MQVDPVDAGLDKMVSEDSEQIHNQALALPEDMREALMLSLLASLSGERKTSLIPDVLANYSSEDHRGTMLHTTHY